MNNIKELKTMLEKEIGNYVAKGSLTKEDWKTVFDAVDALKDMETICAMQDQYDKEGSSSRGRRYYPVSGMMPDEYGGNSYRNGGGYQGNSYQGSSYHGESFNDQLRRLMQSASTPEERAAAQNMMNLMQNRY